MNFIDDIDLNEIAEQISNATDILHDVADFINTEAEKYGRITTPVHCGRNVHYPISPTRVQD